MTASRLATALAVSIVCASMSSAKMIHFASQARDPGVKHWIWYQVLGPRNSPYMILYFSTQHFETYIGEALVVLPSAKYDIVSSYTRARVRRSDCVGNKALENDWYTVQIAEHDNERTLQCMLPQHLACDYLSGVVNLRNASWSKKELRPVMDFMSQIKCRLSASERSGGGSK